MPDVANLPALEAAKRLTAAGFPFRNVDETSPTLPAGTVTRTDPPPAAGWPQRQTR